MDKAYPPTIHKGSGSPNSGDPNITKKELEIREKLEEEVEGGLEDEIKDGIYRLALRLARLYESQKERIMKSKQGSFGRSQMKPLSEVNISIKIDGGVKVEFREAKKEARNRMGTPRRVVDARCSSSGSGMRLDWAKSLRPDGVKKRQPFRFG